MMFGFVLAIVLLFDPAFSSIDATGRSASFSRETIVREVVASLTDSEGMDYSSLVKYVATISKEMKEQNAKMNIMMSTIEKQSDDIEELKQNLGKVEAENKTFRKLISKCIGVNRCVEQNCSQTDINSDEMFTESSDGELLNGDKHIANQRRRGRSISTANVAFTAYLDHRISGMNPGTTIKCNRIITNQGNGYNTFTGIFTAPVSGTYYITYTIECSHKKTNVRLMKDGVNIVDAVVHSDPYSSTYRQGMSTNSAVVDVNAGQSLWLETIYNHDAELLSLEDYRYVTFTGFLIF